MDSGFLPKHPFFSCSKVLNRSSHWHWWFLCTAAWPAWSRDIDCQVTDENFVVPCLDIPPFLGKALIVKPMFEQVGLFSVFFTSSLCSGTTLQQAWDFVICKVRSKHLMMNILLAVHYNYYFHLQWLYLKSILLITRVPQLAHFLVLMKVYVLFVNQLSLKEIIRDTEAEFSRYCGFRKLLLSPTQKTCPFTNGNEANVSVHCVWWLDQGRLEDSGKIPDSKNSPLPTWWWSNKRPFGKRSSESSSVDLWYMKSCVGVTMESEQFEVWNIKNALVQPKFASWDDGNASSFVIADSLCCAGECTAASLSVIPVLCLRRHSDMPAKEASLSSPASYTDAGPTGSTLRCFQFGCGRSGPWYPAPFRAPRPAATFDGSVESFVESWAIDTGRGARRPARPRSCAGTAPLRRCR